MSSDPTIATQVEDEAHGERRWVRFACPHCLKHLKAEATPPGGEARQFTCSRCGGRVVLPARPKGPGDSVSGRPAVPVIAHEPEVPVPSGPPVAPPPPPVVVARGHAPMPAPTQVLTQAPPDPMAALARRAQAARDAAPGRRTPVPTHRRRTPWWMVIAHVSIPVGTVYALWWLHANGYLPAFDGPSTVTIVRPAPPSSATTPATTTTPDGAVTPPPASR